MTTRRQVLYREFPDMPDDIIERMLLEDDEYLTVVLSPYSRQELTYATDE